MVFSTHSAEQSIACARACVMIYDDVNKRWVPSGSTQAPCLSKVHIYQHAQNSTYRVVGRKLEDMEVVINCPLRSNLRYNHATATFHQWRDSRQVYGLNFASKNDADNFAAGMSIALEMLTTGECLLWF